jgi:hypothetical protein
LPADVNQILEIVDAVPEVDETAFPANQEEQAPFDVATKVVRDLSKGLAKRFDVTHAEKLEELLFDADGAIAGLDRWLNETLTTTEKKIVEENALNPMEMWRQLGEEDPAHF